MAARMMTKRSPAMRMSMRRMGTGLKGITVKNGGKRSVKQGAGLTKAGVAAHNRMNPGSMLMTAVTGKVKPGSKAAKRRKSFCARSRMWMGERGLAARRRWRC